MSEQADTRLWSVVVFLGLACGLALGAVAVLIFRDRRTYQAPQLGMPSFELPPLQPMGVFGMPAQPKSAARTTMISNKSPTQILRATGARSWKVTVRVVSPPGAFATFSAANNPGDSITIPAGGFQDMWLSPGEDLYAQANTANTTVSVSGGEHG